MVDRSAPHHHWRLLDRRRRSLPKSDSSTIHHSFRMPELFVCTLCNRIPSKFARLECANCGRCDVLHGCWSRIRGSEMASHRDRCHGSESWQSAWLHDLLAIPRKSSRNQEFTHAPVGCSCCHWPYLCHHVHFPFRLCSDHHIKYLRSLRSRQGK